MPNRWGLQPARAVLTQERWTVAAAADKIGVDRQHLMHALHGLIVPNPVVRRRLPELLGRPIEDLFTQAVINTPSRFKDVTK